MFKRVETPFKTTNLGWTHPSEFESSKTGSPEGLTTMLPYCWKGWGRAVGVCKVPYPVNATKDCIDPLQSLQSSSLMRRRMDPSSCVYTWVYISDWTKELRSLGLPAASPAQSGRWEERNIPGGKIFVETSKMIRGEILRCNTLLD